MFSDGDSQFLLVFSGLVYTPPGTTRTVQLTVANLTMGLAFKGGCREVGQRHPWTNQQPTCSPREVHLLIGEAALPCRLKRLVKDTVGWDKAMTLGTWCDPKKPLSS